MSIGNDLDPRWTSRIYMNLICSIGEAARVKTQVWIRYMYNICTQRVVASGHIAILCDHYQAANAKAHA